MNNFHLSVRSRRKLRGAHPDLAAVIDLGLDYSPYDFAVTESLRQLSRQKDLVAKGFSKTLYSKHLVQPDGFAHAVDLMAVGDLDRDGDIDVQDKSITWDREIYREIASAILRAAKELHTKVRWGGHFKSFYDGPHFELIL
ncbi:M15 family metallopeptidase [Candidatus Pacearchaeota archaeon]|nr:M15 family metallopeptidase [Candidatus Pacearchaeota archaeon]